MSDGDFNFDPYINTCFREESPDAPLTDSADEGDN